MSFFYLGGLLVSLGCMILIDWRWRLFFWRDARSATIVTLVGFLFYLVWDAAGIVLGIFVQGDSPFMTGIVLAPEMPLEEPVFLIFLVVCTMVLYAGCARLLGRRRVRHSEAP